MIAGSELVQVSDGKRSKVSTLFKKQKPGAPAEMLLYNIHDNVFNAAAVRLPIVKVVGDRDSFRLTTKGGKTVVCSEDQMFWCRVNGIDKVMSLHNIRSIQNYASAVELRVMDDKGNSSWEQLQGVEQMGIEGEEFFSITPSMFRAAVVGGGLMISETSSI